MKPRYTDAHKYPAGYRQAVDTNVADTFKRIRREQEAQARRVQEDQEAQAERKKRIEAEQLEKCRPITKRSA